MARRHTAVGDMTQSTVKHWALLGYLVLVWGFAFALIAVALESFHPLFIVWSRLWMGALVATNAPIQRRLHTMKSG